MTKMASTPKRHRSFESKPKSTVPITFDLYDETFEAYENIQGIIILSFVASLADVEDDNGAGAANAIIGFFEKTLKPESLERFHALTSDPERPVDSEELSEIVGWLMEQYTDRPTTAS